MFALEALEAHEGDCLLLHHGESGTPSLILIDGGPPGVYKDTLRPRLLEIRKERNGTNHLTIQMVMVSHIDSDHVAGVMQMFEESVKQKEQGKERPFRFSTLWFNSFDDLMGNGKDELTAAVGAASAIAAGTDLPLDLPVSRDGALILAGVGQVRRLRKAAKALGTSVNLGFTGLVSAAAAGPPKQLDLGGLKLTVVGPSAAQLADLHEEWEKELAKIKADPANAKKLAAAFLDDSVANLSSTVVVAECEGKRMLLTGDARGDFILQGLQGAGLLDGNGAAHFDLLKVPHHGSDRNTTKEFLQAITADHYVVSADGKHGNPDGPMLEMLRQARAGARYTVYFTNRVPQVAAFETQAMTGGFQTLVREGGKPSITVTLA